MLEMFGAGPIALVVGLLLVVALLWFRRRRTVSDSETGAALESASASANANANAKARTSGVAVTAPRIRLVLKQKLQFVDSRIKHVMREFKALGYESAGRYTIPQMPGVRVWSGIHPQDGTLAWVQEVQGALGAVEVSRFYDDGKVVTAGASAQRDAKSYYPPAWTYQKFSPGTPAAELTRWLAAHPRPGTPPVDVTARNLPALVMRMHADSMDYRLAQEDPTMSEVKSIARQARTPQGTKAVSAVNEEQWDVIRERHLNGLRTAREDAMRDNALRGGPHDISASVAKAIKLNRDDFVFVYERLTSPQVIELALRHSDWAQNDPRLESLTRGNLSAVALFEAIQEELPKGSRYVFVTSVEAPLAARGYFPVIKMGG